MNSKQNAVFDKKSFFWTLVPQISVNPGGKLPNAAPRALLTGMISMLLAAVIVSVTANAAADPSSDTNARVVSISRMWFKNIDEAQYQKAYDNTGTWFRHLVTAEEWIPWMVRDCAKMGKCSQRELAKDVRYETTPNGQFAGEWAYVVFKSSFANTGYKKQLVALKKEPDGVWKVAGYSIDDWKP